MRLGRHVNALRFAQAAMVHAWNDDGPVGHRSRSASLFVYGSVLYEAFDLVPELRRWFEANPHWNRSFGRFGTDEAIREKIQQGSDLHRLRNHVGSHVLPMVPVRSLPRLDLPEYVLARCRGRTVGNMHYELADTMALHYVFDAPATFSQLLEEFDRRGSQLTALMQDFLEAADILIPRAFEAWGFRGRPTPAPDTGES
jgi:hypothetical protein